MASSMSGSTGYKDKVPSGYKAGRMQNFTPEQMDLFQNMFSQVGPDSFTARLAGGDEALFNQLEKPALRQFSGLQGNMASKFSGMGMGGRRSSGFQNEMGSQAANFAQQLQSQRLGLQQGAVKDLMGMSNELLNQRPYENFMVQKQQKQGFDWGGLAKAGLGAAGTFFGGPLGGMAATAFGNMVMPSSGGNQYGANTSGNPYQMTQGGYG